LAGSIRFLQRAVLGAEHALDIAILAKPGGTNQLEKELIEARDPAG